MAMHILVLVQEFYALEAVAAMLPHNRYSGFEPMRHSHCRWYEDFCDYRNKYNKKLAAAIYDYTVLVVAAEMRYADEKASQYLGAYYTDSDASREWVYKECVIYRPRDLLSAGLRLFDPSLVEWDYDYGGEKWWRIAKAGLMKESVSDSIFIDNCVDLSHNSSTYFDKSTGIFYLPDGGDYLMFLDLKRTCEPEAHIRIRQGYEFNRLLWRANNLGIIRERPTVEGFFSNGIDEVENSLMKYQPMVWGSRRLNFSESNIWFNQCFVAEPRYNNVGYCA